ncbi:putative ribonuclease H-like domain-containing protein [Tanacetum coccineum]
MGFIMYQMDVKSAFLYGTIEEEVYVCQHPDFEDPKFPDKVYKVEKALYGLHQAPRAWYETLSTYLLENRFRRGTIDKTLFIKKDTDDAQEILDEFYKGAHFLLRVAVKISSTLIETNKALLKNDEAKDVDVHLYRLMIRSLMYLTAFRHDIMFVVYAYARFQVTPKVLHLHVVKRIFRYLKGQPKLGLWYPRDSPFDLEAFSDSDYAGASLDRKSTIGDGISNEFGVKTGSCKVNAARQDLVLLGETLIDKKKMIITESSIRSDLHLEDAEGTDYLPTTTIFEELAKMGLSAKSTAWNEFSSTMASLIICLATNRKFNLSKYIFNAMVKYLDGGVKFLLYPQFLQVFINQQLGDMSHHKEIYVNPSHIKKLFANMKIVGKDFAGRITPLFDTIMVQASKEVGEDSDHPTDSNQIPIVDQPSTSSQPKQKQKSKRKQRKEAEVAHDEIEHEQTIEIVSSRKRVDKLEKRRKFRTTGLKDLKKVGAAKRIESSYDSLGAQEDASKQGRRIEDIDADAEVTLVNETQERQDENLMFDTGVLDGDEMFMDA